MKRLMLATLVSLLYVATAWAAGPQPIRVLSYNIHHGEGIDGKLDLPRIAQVIKSVAPHLVLLQEVDRNTQRTGAVDQAAELGKLTDMEVAFGGNLPLQGGEYGNAILSRFPFSDVKNHPLPNLTEGEPRGILSAMIKLPQASGGGSCRVMVTHLDHRPADGDRLASIEAVHQLIGDEAQVTIIGGDFNATLDSAVMKNVQTHWTLANLVEMPTIPVDKPKRQIDFVGYRPASGFQVGEVHVLDEAIASDHRAILVELVPAPH